MSYLGLSSRSQTGIAYFLLVTVLSLYLYSIFVLFNSKLFFNVGATLLLAALAIFVKEKYPKLFTPGDFLITMIALTVHSLGAFGLYTAVPLYDELAHLFSSIVVALLGYSAAKFVSRNTRFDIPVRDTVLIIVAVMVFGVLWEVWEYFVEWYTLKTVGTSYLTTYGTFSDTAMDLVFDLVGGIVVAVFDLHKEKFSF